MSLHAEKLSLPLGRKLFFFLLSALMGAGICFGSVSVRYLSVAVGLGILAIVMVWPGIKNWTIIEFVFYVFVISLPLTRASLWNTEFGLQPNMALVLVVGGLLVLRAIVQGEPIRLPRNPINYLWGLFLIIALLSILYSWRIPFVSFRGEVRYVRSVKQVAALAWAMLGYLISLAILRRRGTLLRGLRLYVLIGFGVSLFGLYQFVGSYLGLPFLNPFGFNASFGEAPRFQVGGYTRIWSTASEPAWFGDYLVTVIPLVVSLTIYKIKLWRGGILVNVLILSTMLLALLLTFTRSAYLALGVALLPIIYYGWKKLRRGILIFVGLSIAVLLLDLVAVQVMGDQIPNVWQAAFDRLSTIATTEQYGNEHRYTALIASLNMVRDDPLLGRGYGNYGFFFERFRPSTGRATTDVKPRFPVMTGGILFRIWAELGLAGLLVFLLLAFGLVFHGVKAIKRTMAGTLERAVALGLTSSTVGIFARMFFANSFHFLYTWFVWACLVVAGWQIKHQIGFIRREEKDTWGLTDGQKVNAVSQHVEI